jgi:hypothetical protein
MLQRWCFFFIYWAEVYVLVSCLNEGHG